MTEQSDLERINAVFQVYKVRTSGSVIKYYGEPKVDSKTLFTHLWNDFAQRGYDIELRREHGEYVLLATPASDAGEKKHVNVVLAIATVFAIMLTGAVFFYGVNPFEQPLLIYKGLPFAAAVMFVLGSHELAHYLVAKRRGMRASLPFFIPLPFISPVGTLGALIQLKGAIPDRKSLFDVGVAGPLVGLTAAVVVTIVGLLLPHHPRYGANAHSGARRPDSLWADRKSCSRRVNKLASNRVCGMGGHAHNQFEPAPSRTTRRRAYRQGPVRRQDDVHLGGGSAYPYDWRHLLLFERFKRRNAPILGALHVVVRSRGTSAADQRHEKARC